MWDTDEQVGESTTALFPGSILRERFELLQELGRGGMGVVYKAFDRSRAEFKDRYVAIKILNEELKRHPLAVKSLQREARKAQQLAHPNVVTVYDCDRDGGNVYMVMELLSGRSLDLVIRGHGKGGLPVQYALEIVKGLGAALSYAHQHDIVHSDFKPSNAFLTEDGKVKVLDFGIARAAPTRVSHNDKTMFDAAQLGAISPAYASLEMLRGAEPDKRDDVYALACVTYELLTGYHPYQRVDALKAFLAKMRPRPVRGLSRAQWRALKQGLALLRSERTRSVDTFVSQLTASHSRATGWIAAASLLLLAAGVSGALVWRSNAPRAAALQHDLLSNDPARFAAAITQLHAVPYWLRIQTLLNGDAQVTVVSHFRSEIQQAIAPPRYDYQRARQLLAELGALLPGSRPVSELDRQLNLDMQRELTRLRGGSPATNAADQGATARAPANPTASAASGQSQQQAPAVAQSAPRERAPPPDKLDSQTPEQRRASTEKLKEKFETQAAQGDVAAAGTTAVTLARALGSGSSYAAKDIPRILLLSYVHRAKGQFADGQLDAALQTLKDGRRRFGSAIELKDLQARYLACGDLYARLSRAVVLNVADWRRALEELRATQGDEYAVAEQMLAKTLANRIADQRSANRAAIADTLLTAGRKIFPEYVALLGRGTAGALPDVPAIAGKQP